MAFDLKIPTRPEAIEAQRQNGGGVAAVLPIHYPRALFRAFDLLPVEVWGPPGQDTTEGDAHLQAYTCSIVRCALSFQLSGGLDQVDAICIPHACDSLQGLASLLIDFVPTGKPVLPIYLPRGRRPADTAFLAAEFQHVWRKLSESRGTTPQEDKLLDCIVREEEADARLASLFAHRAALPLSNAAFYRLVRSREYLPAEGFAELADQALGAANESEEAAGVRLILSGLTPEPTGLLEALDDAGALVCGDYMACAGRRLYPASTEADPFRRMADSIMRGPADPTRGCAVSAVSEHLLGLARQSGARGVIHYEVKFCEPEQFYLPQVNQALSAAGLRNLAVEVDLGDPLPDQVVTRIEAFLETLS